MNIKWTGKVTNEELWKIDHRMSIENQIKENMELDWTHIN